MLDFLADTFLFRARLRLRRSLIARAPLFRSDMFYNQVGWRRFPITDESAPPDPLAKWHGCFFTIETDGLHLYPYTRHMDQHLHYPPNTLRWFGRPVKYTDHNNDLWLHLHVSDEWTLLQLRADHYPMTNLMRALKQVASAVSPELLTAYRRRRPYIHFDPVTVHAAAQDLYGAWTVDPPSLTLYLTPLHLVMLTAGKVQRLLALERIQAIESMSRLDQPAMPGVCRFVYLHSDGQREPLAFTLPDHVAFAASLAEAAKRTLEVPPIFHGKKKYEDEWDEDDD